MEKTKILTAISGRDYVFVPEKKRREGLIKVKIYNSQWDYILEADNSNNLKSDRVYIDFLKDYVKDNQVYKMVIYKNNTIFDKKTVVYKQNV